MASEPMEYQCPVCGYPGLNETPYDKYGCPLYGICPCCGTEFGYDDSLTAHSDLRKKWLTSGSKWWSTATLPPRNWNPTEQLRAAGLK